MLFEKKWFRTTLTAVLLFMILFSLWKISEPYYNRYRADQSNSRAQNEFLIYSTTAVQTSASLPDTTSLTTADTTSASVTTSSQDTTSSTTAVQTAEQTTSAQTTVPPTAEQTTTAVTGSIWPQFQLNWNAMQRSNPEIIGWIWAYDTTISFPLLQADDNQKYVTTLYDGVTKGSGGAIFADYRNDPNFSDRNTIIYGHNLNHGVMFGALMYYKSESYTLSHPYFCIMTRQGVLKYEIFSVYTTDAYSNTFTVDFQTEQNYAAFLDMVLDRSLFDIGVVPTVNDLTVTLSTCTNNRPDANERLVIHGRLITEQ